MALMLMSVVVALIGFALLAVITGYKAITRPAKYRLLISATFAVGGVLVLLSACTLFMYTLHFVLGVE
jgi:hypothetical protein